MPVSTDTKRVLILSDGKPGHVNQSIAFARHLDCSYQIERVDFQSRIAKILSYLFDRVGIYSRSLFSSSVTAQGFDFIVSAGSGTYYANKTLAREFSVRSAAIMLPRGYRYNFDLIVAQSHDYPPNRPNILEIPINLSFAEPQGHIRGVNGQAYVSVIIGGDSPVGKLSPEKLKRQLEEIFTSFPRHRFWLTTSRRTSPEVEAVLRQFPFEWSVFYSERQINPIGDFLEYSEYVFITEDSTSMISEAVSFGQANVEILTSFDGKSEKSKYMKMINMLEAQSCLHMYDGHCGNRGRKIRLDQLLKSSSVVTRLGIAQ